MRQLGTLPDAQSGRTLCDYLQSLSIDTRLDQTPEGCVVWVCDEDKIARAREEYQAFLSNPNDLRYTEAAEKVRTQPPREPVRHPAPLRRNTNLQAPVVTLALFVLSVLVTLLFWLPPTKQFVAHQLFIEELDAQSDGLYGNPRNRLDEIRKKDQFWRLITPIFIHFHLLHLMFNMMCLWTLGVQLEKHMGTGRYLCFVVFVGVLSTVAQYYWAKVRVVDWTLVAESNPAGGGLSGVGYGLFGYLWMRVVYDRKSGLIITQGTVIVMMSWFFLCMTGLVGRIGNTAHLVGLALGMIVAYFGAWWQGFGQRESAA